jgi:hypothetical protein
MRACVQSHQLEPLGACRALGPGPRLHADTLLRRRTPGKLGGPPAPSCELAAARYKGQPEDKLKLIFNTYDEDGSGAIDMAEMRKMLTCTLTIEDPVPPAAALLSPLRPRSRPVRAPLRALLRCTFIVCTRPAVRRPRRRR